MPTPILQPKEVPVEVYKKILRGELEKFPRNFWKEEKEAAPSLVRYLIEEVLKWGEKEIKEKFDVTLLGVYKLSGLFRYVYQKKMYLLLADAYPGRFSPWELSMVPNELWFEEDRCVDATRWLILEKLSWSREDIVKCYNKNVFFENNFAGLLKWGWKGKAYRAINLSFPEYEFKPWDLLALPLISLPKEDAICAIQWYIEVKKKWTEEEIRKYWCAQHMQEDSIMRIIRTVFDNQLFEAIDSTYPNRFKPWEFQVPK